MTDHTTPNERTNKRPYTWKPDIPDQRDWQFAKIAAPIELPPQIDLRWLPQMPKVIDQGQLGSCTGCALSAQVGFLHDGHPYSRLFIYYNERDIEGTINQDAGAMIRDGVKSISKLGAPAEYLWPYNIAKFKKRPSNTAYKRALPSRVGSYYRLVTLQDMMQCLANGFPFTFGFTVYESFESPETADTGVVVMPAPEEQFLGGHAVTAVGYDALNKMFIVRNSWGTDWGKGGYFFMPFAYLTNRNLSDDFWTLRK